MERQNHWKHQLPWAMIIFRAALGPAIILINRIWQSGLLLAACILLALLSDIFDGILARRWNVATALLRRCDTIADTFFYASVGVVVLLRYPATVGRVWPWLAALVAVEVTQHLFCLLKFGRLASYHSILAKIWGLLLATALIALLGFGWAKLLNIAIAWGILCNLEGFAISSVLPAWYHDIPTLGYAIWLRRELEYQAEVASRRQIIGI
jgi:phosphatidylglycerophosphate synthase